ncbi:MAG: zinc-binding dehydrogenase [Phycisphaerae bacterium]
MKAIVFEKSLLRYVALKLLGPKRAARIATARWNALCPVSMRDIPEPKLPTGQWVRVTPRLSGICGSDLSVICSKGSPYLSPLTSTPFVLGHEVVGMVTEIGREVAACEDAGGLPQLSVGDRVVLEPALGCNARGIEPPCPACARRQPALCRNVTRGNVSAGIQTGYCRDTGGGWSGGFVAHRGQVHPVPEGVSDAAAVLAEPFACVMHGVLRAQVRDEHTVLVVGCGSIGLLTIAAIRARGSAARIIAVAKYEHQGSHARALGADAVLAPAGGKDRQQRYRAWAQELGAELYHPEIGKPTVIGGADVTLDCIGSSASIDDSVRFTDAGGQVVLVGMPGIPSNIDWTAIWYKELSLHAAYAYGPEQVDGEAGESDRTVQTWDLAIEAVQSWSEKLVRLVGEPFELSDYRRALHAALFTGVSRSVKTVFRIST